MRLILLILLVLAIALASCGSQNAKAPAENSAVGQSNGDESSPSRSQRENAQAPYPPKDVETPILEEALDLDLGESPQVGPGRGEDPDPLMVEAERLLAQADDTGIAEVPPGTTLQSANVAPFRSPYQIIVGLRPIHFGFDQAELTPEARQILDQNVRWILDNPEVGIRVEGHCDERGTAAYNLALGQRRAERVLRYLVSKGVPRNSLAAVSFGEEVPIAFGHDPMAWSLNRRVDFSYLDGNFNESTSQLPPR